MIDYLSIFFDSPGCYNWKSCFVLFPKTTISGKRIFFTKAYKRRVRVLKLVGNPVEDVVQYGTIFDLISNKCQSIEVR